MTEAVLDASAVLAVLQRELGHETVAAVMPRSLISTVNLAEVVAKMIERGTSIESCRQVVAALPLTKVPFDEDLALRTGRLRAETRDAGLSLGDRAYLALAEREGLPAITTGRSWSRAAVSVEVRVVR